VNFIDNQYRGAGVDKLTRKVALKASKINSKTQVNQVILNSALDKKTA
jgi:hypothetical protein